MKKTRISLLACLLLLGALFFTSCEKDGDIEPDVASTVSFLELRDNNDEFELGQDGEDIECFAFQYPISIKFPDGNIVEVDNDEALENLIDEWFDNNDDDDEEPILVFPIDVVLEDGSTKTVADDKELCDLFEACYGDEDEWEDDDDDDDEDEEEDEDYDEWEEDCFDVVFPITINFPDGTSTVVNNEDELENALDTWFDANPDAEAEPLPEFPVDVTLEDGTVKTIENEEELEALFEYCEEEYEDDDDEDDDEEDDDHDEWEENLDDLCFDLVYPLEVKFPDGTTQTVNSNEELLAACEAWFSNNPDSEDGLELVFPISIKMDEETKVINNEEEFENALDYCEKEWDEWDCVELHFPLTLILPDGTRVEVGDEDALEEAVENYYDANPDVEEEPTFDYPITVTVKEDGSTVTVNSDEELEDLLDEC